MADLMGDDPVADFLQQENDQLRELGIEDAQFDQPVNEIEGDFEADYSDVIHLSGDHGPGLINGYISMRRVAVKMAEVRSPKKVHFAVEVEMTSPRQTEIWSQKFDPYAPSCDSDVHVDWTQAASASSPMPYSSPLVEPESIRRWREEKALLLADMDEREHSDRQVWLDQARKELDDWQSRYHEQLEKVFHENRTSQAQFLEEMMDAQPGNEWEKAARFCDFNPKNSKNTKDVSRMRGLLLQLKQSPLER